MQDFKKLEVWNESMKIAKSIYSCTKNFPKEELYGIVTQMRRSAVSIPSNIAEGAGRQTPKEFNQFLNFALGSSY